MIVNKSILNNFIRRNLPSINILLLSSRIALILVLPSDIFSFNLRNIINKMRKSDIKFLIELDQQNIPEKISWEATDNPTGKREETKAVSLSIWDPYQKNTLRIDLWTKDMVVEDMKQFVVESISGMAEMIKNATNDEFMSGEMKELCKKLVKHIDEEQKKNSQ